MTVSRGQLETRSFFFVEPELSRNYGTRSSKETLTVFVQPFYLGLSGSLLQAGP